MTYRDSVPTWNGVGPWPNFTESPVVRDGYDNGREAETGE
jgi:hypothetical protein